MLEKQEFNEYLKMLKKNYNKKQKFNKFNELKFNKYLKLLKNDDYLEIRDIVKKFPDFFKLARKKIKTSEEKGGILDEK